MKIVIVSSSDSGGAGIAALRLHKALLAYGADSHMLCLHKSTNEKNVVAFNKSVKTKIIEHLPIPYRQNKYKKYYQELGRCYECFSFPEAVFDISEHPLIKEADIINLHWVGSMLNYPHFFANVNKPIIWTLHDRNPFLGIAHLYGDRDKNVKFLTLEKEIQLIKENAIKQHRNITIINLCGWMKEYSEKSNSFKDAHHVIIPNSVDTTIFKIYDKTIIRNLFDIPLDKPVFMFACQTINNFWKGFDILVEAIKKINKECYFLVIGSKTSSLLNTDNIKYLGTIKDERLMALMYSASDAFLLPTREDNLPNTMVESLCCGVPVISFTNGGMRDTIKTMFNGILVEQMDSTHFANAINIFIDNIDRFDKDEISQDAISKFNPQVQAKNYMDLFSNILCQ